jgi:hypothetical protein
VSILINADTVRKGLRDHRNGLSYDVIDSRVPGLMLRVKPSGCRWSVRSRLNGEQKRWDLGPAIDSKDSLETARANAMQVRELTRAEKDPSRTVAFMLGGRPAVERLDTAVAEARRRPSITWEAAKELFWIEKKRSNRDGTLRDYQIKLNAPEFNRFARREVADITANELARAYADIHARAEPMADGCLRVVKAFWSFLRDASRADITGVTVDLKDVRRLPGTLVEDGDPNKPFDPDKESRDAPPDAELGIALAITRCQGALRPREAYGLQLLMASVQRRRAVTGSTVDRFMRYAAAPHEQAWFVPPYFRKTRSKRGSRSHLIPILGFGAEAVRQLEKLADDDGWLFPAQRGEIGGHQQVNALNKLLSALPGVSWSPHAVRYAFADFVGTLQGYGRSDARIILDHSEGVEPDDVTGQFYATNSNIARKRDIMSAWVEHLNRLADEAIQKDPRLLDREWIQREVFLARNGEARLAKRIADRAAIGTPLWKSAHI